MVAPIFKFKSLKVTLSSNAVTSIYGVEPFNTESTYTQLDSGVLPADVSALLLTVQCSNTTGSTTAVAATPINISAFMTNTINNTRQILVYNYPVIPNNAFDPLNGNLVMTAGDVLQIQSSLATGNVDVIVSLLEIANATSG